MRLSSFAGIAAVVVTLAAAPAASAADAFAVNKPHTLVAFSVERLGLTKVLGSFSKVDGEFSVDRDNPVASSASLTIDTSSIYTGFEARDKHLRSPDFFNVQEFPEMKFVSTKVERTGEKTAKVTGNLTLLGVTKPVTLDVVLNNIKQDARTKKDLAGFSAHGTLKRSDFGMKYLMGAIGDDVTLMGSDAGVLQYAAQDQTWKDIGVGLRSVNDLCVSGDTWYALTLDGIFKRRDGQSDWTPLNVQPAQSPYFSLVPGANGDLYVGTGQGVFKFDSNASKWSEFPKKDSEFLWCL